MKRVRRYKINMEYWGAGLRHCSIEGLDGIDIWCDPKDVRVLEDRLAELEANPKLNNDIGEEPRTSYEQLLVDNAELRKDFETLELITESRDEAIISSLISRLQTELETVRAEPTKHELTSIEQEEEIAVLKDKIEEVNAKSDERSGRDTQDYIDLKNQFTALQMELKVTSNLLGEKCEEVVDLKRQVLTPIDDESLIHVSRFRNVQKQRDWLINCICEAPEVDRLKLISRMEEEIAKDKS